MPSGDLRYRRGEIWWVNLDPTVGSETAKKRPCVILQNDVGNARSDTYLQRRGFTNDNPDIARKSLPNGAMHFMIHRFDRKLKKVIMARLSRSILKPEPLKSQIVL